MIIPPKKPLELSLGKKRRLPEEPDDRRTAARDFKSHDVSSFKHKTVNVTAGPITIAPSLVTPTNSNRPKTPLTTMGPKSHLYQSLEDLRKSHENKYFPYNKPLTYLHNHDHSIFVAAKSYIEGYTIESNAELTRGADRPRTMDLIAGFIHPQTKDAVNLGPISAESFEDSQSLLFSLLVLPAGDNKFLDSEAEFSLLAQCMYCFDVGQHVTQDLFLARSMQTGLDADGIHFGNSIAMHHAAANNDTKQALYFLNKGADPREIWDENHRDSLDEALLRNNKELVIAFLGKMTKKDRSYLEYAIRPNQFRVPDLSSIVLSKIESFLTDK